MSLARSRKYSFFNSINGGKVHYVELGHLFAKPIFMVHGFRGDHHGLLPLTQDLEDYKIIIPDLPGFGKSTKLPRKHTINELGTWFKTFVEKTTKKSFYVLGHSFGSVIVANAIKQGLTPDKVILVNPISQPALTGPNKLLSKSANFYYRLGSRLPNRCAKGLLKNQLIVRFMSAVMAKTKDRELRNWIHNQHRMYFSNFTDKFSILEAFESSTNHSVVEYTPWEFETLLIAGEKDNITPLSAQLKLKYFLPKSDLHILKETGHLIHYEKPAQVSYLTKNFLVK